MRSNAKFSPADVHQNRSILGFFVCKGLKHDFKIICQSQRSNSNTVNFSIPRIYCDGLSRRARVWAWHSCHHPRRRWGPNPRLPRTWARPGVRCAFFSRFVRLRVKFRVRVMCFGFGFDNTIGKCNSVFDPLSSFRDLSGHNRGGIGSRLIRNVEQISESEQIIITSKGRKNNGTTAQKRKHKMCYLFEFFMFPKLSARVRGMYNRLPPWTNWLCITSLTRAIMNF